MVVVVVVVGDEASTSNTTTITSYVPTTDGTNTFRANGIRRWTERTETQKRVLREEIANRFWMTGFLRFFFVIAVAVLFIFILFSLFVCSVFFNKTIIPKNPSRY